MSTPVANTAVGNARAAVPSAVAAVPIPNPGPRAPGQQPQTNRSVLAEIRATGPVIDDRDPEANPLVRGECESLERYITRLRATHPNLMVAVLEDPPRNAIRGFSQANVPDFNERCRKLEECFRVSFFTRFNKDHMNQVCAYVFPEVNNQGMEGLKAYIRKKVMTDGDNWKSRIHKEGRGWLKAQWDKPGFLHIRRENNPAKCQRLLRNECYSHALFTGIFRFVKGHIDIEASVAASPVVEKWCRFVFGNVIGYLKMNKVALLDTSGKFPDIRNFAKETYLSKRMWEMVTTSKTKNSRIFSQDVVMYDDYRFARRTEIEEFPSLSDDDAFAGDDSDDDMDAEDVL